MTGWKINAARGIASGKKTNGRQGGGPRKQGLSGQSITKTGPTLGVNHKLSQRSVMRYNNGLIFCTNQMSGGIGRRGGQGSLFSKMDGLHCESSYQNRPQFSYANSMINILNSKNVSLENETINDKNLYNSIQSESNSLLYNDILQTNTLENNASETNNLHSDKLHSDNLQNDNFENVVLETNNLYSDNFQNNNLENNQLETNKLENNNLDKIQHYVEQARSDEPGRNLNNELIFFNKWYIDDTGDSFDVSELIRSRILNDRTFKKNSIHRTKTLQNDLATARRLIPGSQNTQFTSSDLEFSDWRKTRGSGMSPLYIHSINALSECNTPPERTFDNKKGNTLYIRYSKSTTYSQLHHIQWSTTNPQDSQLAMWDFDKNPNPNSNVIYTDFISTSNRVNSNWYSVLSHLNYLSYLNDYPELQNVVNFDIQIDPNVALQFPIGFDSRIMVVNNNTSYADSLIDLPVTVPNVQNKQLKNSIQNINVWGGGIISGTRLKSDYNFEKSGLLQLVAQNHITIKDISVLNGWPRQNSSTQINAYNVPPNLRYIEPRGIYKEGSKTTIQNCEFCLHGDQNDALDVMSSEVTINNVYFQSHDDCCKLSTNISDSSEITIFGGGGGTNPPGGGAGGCLNIGSYGFCNETEQIDIEQIHLHNTPNGTVGDGCNYSWTGRGIIYCPYVMREDNQIKNVILRDINDVLSLINYNNWDDVKNVKNLFVGGFMNDPSFGALSWDETKGPAPSSKVDFVKQYYEWLNKTTKNVKCKWDINFNPQLPLSADQMTAIYSNITQFWEDWQDTIGIEAPTDNITKKKIANMVQITINGELFNDVFICKTKLP